MQAANQPKIGDQPLAATAGDGLGFGAGPVATVVGRGMFGGGVVLGAGETGGDAEAVAVAVGVTG
jgi:hypothetical protein